MLLAFALALSVAAQPPATPDFDEGKRLYFDLEFELAVFRFRAAARSEGLAPKERALVYAWLGLSYAQVAEMESAREAFADAVALDLDVSLPQEASPPPKALQLLEEARAEAKEKASAPAAPSTPEPVAAGPPAAKAAAVEGAPSAGLGPALLAGGGVAAALGVLALGAGATLGVIALSTADEGNAAAFQDDAAALKDDAETSALAANLSYLLGGVLVAVGAITLGAGFAVE